jgi:hypothetical protein
VFLLNLESDEYTLITRSRPNDWNEGMNSAGTAWHTGVINKLAVLI